MKHHTVVTREEWNEARAALLASGLVSPIAVPAKTR
jgi:hypothetical protein